MKNPLPYLSDLVEKNPFSGYVGAIFPTSVGLGVLFDRITALFGLLSVMAGFGVAVVTLYIQLLQVRKLRKEGKNNNDKTNVA